MPTPDPVAATTRCPWCGYEPADEEHECSRFSETEPPADSSAAYSPRDLAEQTLDGTLPYEESWRENAQNAIIALDLLRAVQIEELNGRLCPRPDSPKDRCCPVCRDLWRRIDLAVRP